MPIVGLCACSVRVKRNYQNRNRGNKMEKWTPDEMKFARMQAESADLSLKIHTMEARREAAENAVIEEFKRRTPVAMSWIQAIMHGYLVYSPNSAEEVEPWGGLAGKPAGQ